MNMVNDPLLPATVALGSGSVLGGAILIAESRAEAAMRASRIRLAITFPANADPVYAKAALAGIAGTDDRFEYVFEVEATAEGIRHYLLVPAEARASVIATLTGALPGLRAVEAPSEPSGHATISAKLFVPTPCVLSTENPASASRTLLAGVAGLAPRERACLKWAVRSGTPRPYTPKEPVTRTVREVERAWRHKVASGAGFRAAGLVVVAAPSISRAREICEHLTSSLRSRRGPVGALRVTSERGNRRLSSLPKTTHSSGWVSVSEFVGLCGMPLGEPIPGVEVGGARELLVPRYVPRVGRPLFVGRDSQGERVVALDPLASRQHMTLVAGTGSGKSVFLMRGMLADVASGAGGILLDPKNDLASDLLDRIPPEHAERVVVLDPMQPRVPGLDLFGAGDPDLRSDVILSALRGVYRDAWGVRIDAYLRAGLRALAELDEPVLSDWIRLFTEPALRATAVGRLRDPILLSQWQSFEALSAAEQFQHVAPALSRITNLLSRPALRNIINQPNPRLSIPKLLDDGHWLVVSLAPGGLGEAASSLLSALVGYLIWSAIEARVAVPASQRRPVYLYCDELASLHLPVGLEQLLERSRGLGCGIVTALQDLSRLSDSARSSLLVNSGTILSFKASGDAAARLAKEMPPLTPADLMGLGRFEIAGRVHTGERGRGSVTVTGRTEGPPPTTGQAEVIRRLSAERYGRDPREIEEALARRHDAAGGKAGGGYGRTGRAA
jgi:hypothetical protein